MSCAERLTGIALLQNLIHRSLRWCDDLMARFDRGDGSNGRMVQLSNGERVVRRPIYELGRRVGRLGHLAAVAAMLALTSCAHIDATTMTLAPGADRPKPPATISIYPLDPHKVYDPVYAALAADLTADLKRRGYVVEPQFTKPGEYMTLIDYAIEVGVDRPWNRYTTVIVYNTATHHKVFQEDAESDGSRKDVAAIGKLLLKRASLDLSKPQPGVKHVRIY